MGFLARGLGSVFIPEEILTLGEFLFLGFGSKDGLESVGVVTSVEHLCGSCHRCRGKVLHLLQFVAHLLGKVSKLCHVLLTTTRVRGDEVRDELLTQTFFLVYAVKDALEVIEKLEGGFAHVVEHCV
jgi:hypothetical protein